MEVEVAKGKGLSREWKLSVCKKEKEKEKEKLVVKVIRSEEKGLFKYGEFFIIDTEKGEISEIPYILVEDRGYSMASIGSVLYVLGGSPFDENLWTKRLEGQPPLKRKGIFHKGMSYLDLDSDFGWKEATVEYPFDLLPTLTPSVVSFGGKLYVFPNWGRFPTARVFDPTCNKWDVLLPPPGFDCFDVNNSKSVLLDSKHNRFLVHFSDILSYYAYYPTENRWELFADHLLSGDIFAFADGVFYIYSPTHPRLLTAYDAASKQWLKVEFTSEIPHRVWTYEFDAISSLGNDLLCITGSQLHYFDTPQRTELLLVKLRTKRTSDRPNDLIVTLLPLESYTVLGRCSRVNYLPI